MKKIIIIISIILVIVGAAIVGFFQEIPHEQTLEELALIPEFDAKINACHKKGMYAGRLNKDGKVIDIKCYEK